MSYAVFQTRIAPIPREALARTIGVVLGGLAREQAERLAQALNAEGLPTEVVDECDVIALPPARHVQRIDCLPDGLILFDALQRTTTVAWNHVVVIAAGVVAVDETKRIEKDRIVLRSTGWRGTAVPVVVTDVTRKEEHLSRLRLEICFDVPPGRVRFQGHEGQYNYLGPRRQPLYMDNFVLLVKDLAGCARGAALNRAADSLCADRVDGLRYPTEHAFEGEIVWLLWARYRRAAPPSPV